MRYIFLSGPSTEWEELTKEIPHAGIPDIQAGALRLSKAWRGPGRDGLDDAIDWGFTVRGGGGVPAIEVRFLQGVAAQVHQAHLCRAQLAFARFGGEGEALHAREDRLVVRFHHVHDCCAAEVEECGLQVL